MQGTTTQTIIPPPNTTSALSPRSFDELIRIPPSDLGRVDIARMNMLCAEGLPGAEDLDVELCLKTLDHWTIWVRNYTRDGIDHFHAFPQQYQHHKGAYNFLSMVTVLKHHNGLNCQYQETAVDNFIFLDSRDDLIHGLLTRRLGTCASFPVLFVAIGRRLGYPMFLAVANAHLYCQWVDETGHLNLDGACPGGGLIYPDSEFFTGKYPLTRAMMATGHFLRPLKPEEELSLFLETRGHILRDNGHKHDAIDMYELAFATAPDWSLARMNFRYDEFIDYTNRQSMRTSVPDHWPIKGQSHHQKVGLLPPTICLNGQHVKINTFRPVSQHQHS